MNYNINALLINIIYLKLNYINKINYIIYNIMKKTNFNQMDGESIKGGKVYAEGYTDTAVSSISNEDYIKSSILSNNTIKNIDNAKLNNFINLMNSNKPKNINVNELLKK